MEDIFADIAKEENGNFIQTDITSRNGLMGNSFPQSDYDLEIDYNGHQILIHNTLGPSSVGSVEMMVSSQVGQIDFKLTTKNHFAALFSRKKEMIKISCKNLDFKEFLLGLKELDDLHHIIQEVAFEPVLTCIPEIDGIVIRTEYHLAFEERREVLRPLIAFYKALANKLG
jgi:hypothetical protein